MNLQTFKFSNSFFKSKFKKDSNDGDHLLSLFYFWYSKQMVKGVTLE